MYVEGKQQDDVENWVSVVRNLKYKDFQLVTRPQALTDENQSREEKPGQQMSKSAMKKKAKHEEPQSDIGLAEVESVKDFGSVMEKRGVLDWWRRGMGYTS